MDIVIFFSRASKSRKEDMRYGWATTHGCAHQVQELPRNASFGSGLRGVERSNFDDRGCAVVSILVLWTASLVH
jgi:hypothetical protein